MKINLKVLKLGQEPNGQTKGKKSSYFLRLENKHQSKNTINKINNAGSNFIKTKDILDQLCNFYENLYSSNDVPINDIDTYLDNINVSSVLSEKEKEMCENLPTLNECAEAVNGMKNNKSPGIDGLPTEFYKMFWKNLKHYLYEALFLY